MRRPEVPHAIEQALDPGWLSAALGVRFPGIEVTAVTPGPELSRISTTARFTIECAGGLPDELPAALCVKGYFRGRGLDLVHVGEAEAFYYRNLEPTIGVRGMRSFYADIHPETRHGVVIVEDVVHAGGRFQDALSPYTVDDVAESLELLARLHGATWDVPALRGERRIQPRIEQLLGAMEEDQLQRNIDDYGPDLPETARSAAQLRAAIGALAARSETADDRWCLVHGDAHVGNVFVDGGGRLGLFDFQLVQFGHWSVDIGYHITSALPQAEREKSELDLLRHYLDVRRAYGAADVGWDEAWTDYRAGIPYGYFLWASTLLVERPIIIELVHRLGEAVAAHESYDLLEI